MRKLFIIPLAALALSLAACGGPSVNEKFADDVNRIQTQAANKINATLASGDDKALRETAAAEFNVSASRISALKVESGAKDERDALVSTLRSGATAVSQAEGDDGARALNATAAQISQEIKDLNSAL